MKQNVYEIEKNVEKILRGHSTGFLTNSVRLEIEKRLRNKDYFIFSPFKEAEKIILYSKKMPEIRLFKICCYKDTELKHSSILGSLFGLNITNEMFGDIVKWQGNFYVYLLNEISDLVTNELSMVGNMPVSLKEVSLNLLDNFEREYESYELIVSSLRIDTVIGRLIQCNRGLICDKIKNQEVFVNEALAKKASSLLAIGDIFSIRKYGKYRFREIVGKTKKNNFIIRIDKYI